MTHGNSSRDASSRAVRAILPNERASMGLSFLFRFVSRAAALCISVTIAACATRTVYVVEAPPPSERVEIIGPPPSGNHVWVAGHWHWTGAEYTWIPGHWIMRPH